MTGAHWHLITGEYPPQAGGVADYTAILARALDASGCDVHIWAPAVTDGESDGGRVHVHRLPGGFGDAGLHTMTAELERLGGPRVMLVQYVPQAFGARGMNVAFCRWVQHRTREHRDDVRVMFHEPYYPFVFWPLRRNLLALVNRLMAVLLLSDIRVAYVSTEAWQRRLRRYAPRARNFVWLPIASTVPRAADEGRIGDWRAWVAPTPEARVVGHFGTYGPLVTRLLAPALARVLSLHDEARLCLVGEGGDALANRLCADRPEWRSRVTATGHLAADEVAACLRACDVMLQPYADGASGRRTTLMAALVNGVPVVTNRGRATEPVWDTSGAVVFPNHALPESLGDAVVQLLNNPDRCRRVATAGAALYAAQFAIARTVGVLLSPGGRPAAP